MEGKTRKGQKKQGAQSIEEMAREARREYKRNWNRNNKDKVKAAQERYWKRKAEAAQNQADGQGRQEALKT